MKKLFLTLSLVTLMLSTFAAEPPVINLKVQKISGGLLAPTAVVFPAPGEIWVTEQTGKVRLIKNGKLSEIAVLDLSSKLPRLNKGYEERGLLGIALHPQFKTNRKFYVYYSAPSPGFDHKGVVSEFTVDAAGLVDLSTEKLILSLNEPEGNHNGGCVQFGKDGYLYISYGDGGGQGDKHGEAGNGQNMSTWLGKILRVDINTSEPYKVPADNPFVGQPNIKPEIFAYGFRNPYRFSFDKLSGQLFAGEVGQDLWEEVNIVKKGGNYGWRITEGTHCYNPATGCDVKGIIMPILEYPHREGVSVTGGYVYNGKTIPMLKGKYVFADWTGPMWYLQKVGTAWQRGKITLSNIPEGLKVTGFGEDPAGEIYMVTNPDTGPGNSEGGLFKITK